MKNIQLIKLLKTFCPKDIKKFGEFVSSPYFNKNKNVIKLYEVIKKAHPDFEQEDLTKENLFSSIFPGKKYNDNTLRLLIHLLYENARKFLAHTQFEERMQIYEEVLVQELYDRKLYKESLKEIDKEILGLEKIDKRDSEYFLYKYLFENLKLFCIRRIRQKKYEKYIAKSSFETTFENLTRYFFGRLLTSYTVALNTKITYNIDIDTTLFEKLFSYIDQELFNNIPLIQVYYYIVMTLKTNDDKHFYILKDFVQKHEKSLHTIQLYNVYVIMQSFCGRKILAGEKHFHREYFEILKLNLEKKIYKFLPFMHQNFYKNILRTAAELKEFEWANDFIKSYKNELHPDLRESVYFYCKAYLEAEKENFEKSLDYLSTLKTEDLYFKIDLKLLQARLYYELNWFDVLDSTIDTTRHFLKSNKFISEERRAESSTFIRFLSALNNAKLKKDELKIMELKDKINKTKDLLWKDWFIKKVEELETAL